MKQKVKVLVPFVDGPLRPKVGDIIEVGPRGFAMLTSCGFVEPVKEESPKHGTAKPN